MHQQTAQVRRPARKKRMCFAALFALAIIMVLCFVFAPWRARPAVQLQSAPIAEAAAKNAATAYTLRLAYDEQLHTLSGEEIIDVQNCSGQAWSEICINDWPSAETFVTAVDGGMTEFTDCTITTGGQSYDMIPVRDAENSCLLRIPLGDALQSGESLRLKWNMLVHIPRGNDRFGYNDVSCNLGSFIPQLALWREDGWAAHPYCTYGESMAAECADFSMTLDAPVNLMVICTGESSTQNGVTTATAKNVRDFCMVIGSGWHVAEKQHGGVLVRSFYKGSFIMGREALHTALDALDAYGSTIGAYPYATLDIVETDIWAAGLEYPQLLMMSSHYYAWSFDLIHGYVHDQFRIKVAHEVAHEWFYGVVGNDQYDEAWLDEGFATYLEHIYADYVGLHHATIYAEQDHPLNTSLDSLTKDTYNNTVYTCANAFLTDLSDIIGQEALAAVLRNLYMDDGYSVVHTDDVLSVIRKHTPPDEEADVEALIAAYLNP